MKKKLTSVLLFLAMSVGAVSAQTSKVTGKVIGEDGEPVIGASIIVKGTTVGTVTDFDGNFTLDVPSDGKQLVGFIHRYEIQGGSCVSQCKCNIDV